MEPGFTLYWSLSERYLPEACFESPRDCGELNIRLGYVHKPDVVHTYVRTCEQSENNVSRQSFEPKLNGWCESVDRLL